MPNKMNLLIFSIGLSCIIQTGLAKQGQQCYTPEKDIGQCLPLINCTSIQNFVNSYARIDTAPYSITANQNCGNEYYGGEPLVCCRVNQEYLTTNITTKPRIAVFPTNTPSTTLFPSIFIDPPTTTVTFDPVPSITQGITNRQSKVESECTGPDFKQGTCTPLAQCKSLATQLQANPKNDTFANFLKLSNKICDNEYSVVCCPKENAIKVIPGAGAGMVIFPRNINEIPSKLPTMADGCGYVHKSNRKIVGGAPSKMGAWPWIALIGYDDGVSTSSSPFKCGGALITSRHVLTAAHCIRADLSFVRLGEHDLSVDTEAKHVDVPVVRNLRHPRYNKTDGHNDIALLYLAQNVQFSEKITPICLPFESKLRSKDITGSNPFVAGWGRTMEGGKPATVLQELQIEVIDNEVCKDKYKKQGKFVSEQQFDSAVICAGDLDGGKDTCQGDSGGPLMLPEFFENSFRFHLIGIVSYGIGCARRDVPGVYSRVTNFIEWIENGVADTA